MVTHLILPGAEVAVDALRLALDGEAFDREGLAPVDHVLLPAVAIVVLRDEGMAEAERRGVRSQMPLADGHCVPAVLREDLREGGARDVRAALALRELGGQRSPALAGCVDAVVAEVADAGAAVLAAEQAGAGGLADGVVRHGVLEAHAARRQRIDVRRPDEPAVAAELERPELVGDDHDHVGSSAAG